VGHHRFSVVLNVIMSEPGNTDMSKPDSAPEDLATDLTKEIKVKSRPKKSGTTYVIEQVTRLPDR
jgi:hypothetical protein